MFQSRQRPRISPLLGAILALGVAATSGLIAPPATAATEPVGLASGKAVHLTWRGYRGVSPGERLAKAARHLDGHVRSSCIFRYIHYSGPIYMDDAAMGNGRVNQMLGTDQNTLGPKGIHPGMTAGQVKRALGPDRKTGTNFGIRYWLLAGPGGVTEWTSLGSSGPGATTWVVGLSPSIHIARKAVSIEGC